MEHSFVYDLCEGIVIMALLYDVYVLKKRVRRLEDARKSPGKKDDLWEKYERTRPK